MENSRHFIITRFNLNLYKRDKNSRPTRTDRWLEHRFEVFERYCLPSVAAQTNKRFTWLCLFDAATPERYRGRIEGYKNICPQFEAVYYDAGQAADLTVNLRRTILAFAAGSDRERAAESASAVVTGEAAAAVFAAAEPDGRETLSAAQAPNLRAARTPPRRPEWLITTNLDNDDAFAADVVELLQHEIRPASGKRIYSLLYGYQYFSDRRFVLKMRYTNNHFLTLAEPLDEEAETIVSYRHTRAIRQQPTVYIATERGKWLEIVHEDNVSNDFRINAKVRNIPVLRGRTFGDFGLPGLRVTWYGQWLKTLFVVPARFLLTAAKSLRRKWKKTCRREVDAGWGGQTGCAGRD